MTLKQSIDMSDEEIAQIDRMLHAKIEVYEVKNPDVNRERYAEREKLIRWIKEQILLGPRTGGVRTDTPYSIFGDDWDAVSNAVRMRDRNRCVICGGEQYEVHHIRPRFLGGKNHPQNLVCLCCDCHDEIHRFIDRGIQEVLDQSLGIDPPEHIEDTSMPKGQMRLIE